MSFDLTPAEALDAALDDYRPGCRDVALFTDDAPTPADCAAMSLVCGGCPIFAECSDYADAEKPRAGYWAGRLRGGRASSIRKKPMENETKAP